MSSLGLKLLQIAVILLLSINFVTPMVSQDSSQYLRRETTEEQRQKGRLPKHQHHTHLHHHHQHRRKHHRISKSLLKSLPTPKDDIEILKDIPEVKRDSIKLSNTRLRHLTARDYYNRVVQRRLNANRNSESDYNTYNVLTNTFGPPPPALHWNSQGDDNRADVEFIGSSSNSNPERSDSIPNHGYDYIPPLVPQTTQSSLTTTTTERFYMKRFPVATAPPLVPHRRGYVTKTTTKPLSENSTPSIVPFATEDPFEDPIPKNISSNWNGSDMERRHICVQHHTVTTPFKTTEIHRRATWKHVNVPCQPQTHANQKCTRVQIVHEPIVRDVIRHKSAQRVIYDCCSGWMRETPTSDSCMKPICSSRCQNGGTCSSPDTCTCPPGFTGRFCETDIDECKNDKPCFQTCVNTIGSFYCACREGFTLQSDQLTCKRIDWRQDDAFEARDMENDVEDEVNVRLHKIERSLENERIQTHELQKSLQATYNVVDTLKIRLTTLEKQQQDLNRLQTNLYATETRTNKLEGMLNLLMKCRNGPNAYCP